MDNQDITKYRNHMVVKHNSLIQKSRHQFTSQQQKAMLYVVSLLRPEQDEFEWQTFDIVEFCEICGIESDGGKNYKALKDALQGLSDKSMWITLEDGTQNLTRWLQNVQIRPKSGKIAIRIDQALKPYLLHLKSNYTEFQLKHTLAMKSKYSVRLYEILRSYEDLSQLENIIFTLARLKTNIGADYALWGDFKRRALDPAIKEINKYSDIYVDYIAFKRGKAFDKIHFSIRKKNEFREQVETERAIYKRINGRNNHT